MLPFEIMFILTTTSGRRETEYTFRRVSRHVERTNSRRTVTERLQTNDKLLTKDCKHG